MLPARYHHRADHDNAEQRGQDLAAPRLLHHRHGPVCDRLLPVCLCRVDGVRHVELLLQQRPAARLHAAQATSELSRRLVLLLRRRRHLLTLAPLANHRQTDARRPSEE